MNIKILKWIIIFELLLAVFTVKLFAFNYVLGDTLYAYSTQAQPAKNKSYEDSTYHTTITRVSDKTIDNYTGARLITGYSTFSGVNSDGKYILLMMCDASAKYALYDTVTNRYIKDLKLESWNGDPEPRWDGSGKHPGWLYFVRFSKLMRMDVDSSDPLGTSVIVHDFSKEYSNCSYIKNDEEGDCSADSRYWAFEIRDSAWKIIRIITYDRQKDAILGSLTAFPYDINCVSISPDGSKVLVDWQYVPHFQGKGPIAYNLDFTTTGSNWAVKNDSTHWCWAQMRNGDLAVVSQNNEIDQIQVCDVLTGVKYNILPHKSIGWKSGFHFFNTGKPGWAGMYTYSTPNSHDSWAYDQIYLIELKTSGRIFRVTFSQHNYKGDYFDEGHAQMDWHLTGAKLWFNSNWRGASNAEVYRVDLPEHWYEDLEGLPYPAVSPRLTIKRETVVPAPHAAYQLKVSTPVPAVSLPVSAQYSNKVSTYTNTTIQENPVDSIKNDDVKVVISSISRVSGPEYTAKIFFKGKDTGRYECRVFTLMGELAWYDAQENTNAGTFEWRPGNLTSAEYVAVITGPAVKIKKKILLFK